jgi:hypothetical protein
MEEASNADRLDSIGSVDLADVSQNVTRVTGIHNHAAQVDSNSLLTGTFAEPANFSVAFWFKTVGSVTDPTEVLFKNGFDFQFDLQIAPDGTANWYVGDPVTPMTSGADKVTFGQWTFVVAGFDGTTARISLNGGTNHTSAQTHTPEDSGMTLYNGTSGVQVLVDEVSFYNRGLSVADIAALWNGGSGFFL